MRSLLAPLFAAGAALLMGIDGCPQPPDDTCPPPDGLMAAGTWGGKNWQMDVDKEGNVTVWTYCATGTSQYPVSTTSGEAAFVADMWFERGGPTTPGIAKIWGTICDGAYSFTYSTDYGYMEDGVVYYGQTGTVEPCPLD